VSDPATSMPMSQHDHISDQGNCFIASSRSSWVGRLAQYERATQVDFPSFADLDCWPHWVGTLRGKG